MCSPARRFLSSADNSDSGSACASTTAAARGLTGSGELVAEDGTRFAETGRATVADGADGGALGLGSGGCALATTDAAADGGAGVGFGAGGCGLSTTGGAGSGAATCAAAVLGVGFDGCGGPAITGSAAFGGAAFGADRFDAETAGLAVPLTLVLPATFAPGLSAGLAATFPAGFPAAFFADFFAGARPAALAAVVFRAGAAPAAFLFADFALADFGVVRPAFFFAIERSSSDAR